MRAIVYTKYGSPDVLQLEEVEIPSPKNDEVLVKVHAASINSWDWDLLRGKPWIVRLWGLLKPKYNIPGGDIAGTVESVGNNAKNLKPGDEVFGDLSEYGWGGFAEYVSVPEKTLTIKPKEMTFGEAAAIPQAGLLAFQGLQDKKQIESGQKVLINGGGGGVGTFAIQIAKSFGAEVTAVDHTAKLDLMRSLGADHVIDYTSENFIKSKKQYDLILDVVASHSISDCQQVLNPGGFYVIVGGNMTTIFKAMLLGPLITKMSDKGFGIMAYKPNRDLETMKELYETGKVKPIIDRSYSLNEVPEAFRYFGEGKVKGKIVIAIIG
jgi:NADPH:quinone reductase-like Zn-dependent oxidoreductase